MQSTTGLWGKLPRVGEAEAGYHPLLCHMIDVAVVAEAMWDHVLSESVRRRMARELTADEGTARRLIASWAGLHDLGKASPRFQSQTRAGAEMMTRQGLPPANHPRPAPHGDVTMATLPSLLTAEGGLSAELATQVSRLVGGHHGIFPLPRPVRGLPAEATRQQPWLGLRHQLFWEVMHSLDVPSGEGLLPLENATAMALAGFVSVADWIGSARDYFPFARDRRDITIALAYSEYTDRARGQAASALSELGWTGWAPPNEPAPFTDLFPFPPNPLQSAVVDLSTRLPDPGIVVIEAPMGDGKTEAAMYLADFWSASGAARGCYFALPTQATSNQMFDRVVEFLARRYPKDQVNVQLLHGHAALSAAFRLLRQNAEVALRPTVDDDTGQPGGDVIAAGWFTHRKRGLLAPFGVGTIDQCLLAVLQTRHVFVRLFGLLGKTVIIDEVHAYDAYMNHLLEQLLKWLGALGSPVVLLSATLPKARRLELIQAYEAGCGFTGAIPAEDGAYPRVTWRAAGIGGTLHVPTGERLADRVLHVKWVGGALPQDGDPFPLGEQLAIALREGGCAAIVCNTVKRAQALYTALKRYFPGTANDGEPELDLLHARFLFDEREQREARARRRFGKRGPATFRPSRAVLVATQVIEQSLDLDFDLIVTDFAPVDLLLQRSGRLHRHVHDRPVSLRLPELWICLPEAVEDGVPRWYRGMDKVYDPHVLLRSWVTTHEKDAIAVVDEMDVLIEAVYDERVEPPDGASDALTRAWQTTRADLVRERQHALAEADLRAILPPTHENLLFDFNHALEEDDPEVNVRLRAATRLGDPSITVVLLGPDEQKEPAVGESDHAFALRMLSSSVPISHRGVVSVLSDSESPSAWRTSSLLRHCRFVPIDATGVGHVGGYSLSVHPELGVVIEKGDPDGGDE